MAATVALQASAIRDSFISDGSLAALQDEDENRSWSRGILCCCRGPQTHLCYTFHAERCPADLGYRLAEEYGLRSLGEGPLVPPRCKAGQKPPTAGKYPVVRVKAYFMRHAMSCANVLAKQRNLGLDPDSHGRVYPDAPLTDAGLQRTEALSELIRARILEQTGGRRPLIFSSYLARTMETGFRSFPGLTVHPIPFVAETGAHPANLPLPFAEQAELLKRPPNTPGQRDKLKFDVGPPNHPDRGCGKHTDYDEFRNFLPGALEELRSSIEGLAPGEDPPQSDFEIPVVIVSHGGYMRNHLQCSTGREPRNNEVWAQTYLFQWGAWDAQLVELDCVNLFPYLFYPTSPQELCASDVLRCSDQHNSLKPHAWLEKYRGNCEELERRGMLDIRVRDKARGEAYVSGLPIAREDVEDEEVANPFFEGGGPEVGPHRSSDEVGPVRQGRAGTPRADGQATCTVTDGSKIGAVYPCKCGSSTCTANEICDARESACTLATCYNRPRKRMIHVYPCTCGAATCSETFFGICDKEKSACSSCDDTAPSRARDAFGERCHDFDVFVDSCEESIDTDDFTAKQMCCACGGGKLTVGHSYVDM